MSVLHFRSLSNHKPNSLYDFTRDSELLPRLICGISVWFQRKSISLSLHFPPFKSIFSSGANCTALFTFRWVLLIELPDEC